MKYKSCWRIARSILLARVKRNEEGERATIRDTWRTARTRDTRPSSWTSMRETLYSDDENDDEITGERVCQTIRDCFVYSSYDTINRKGNIPTRTLCPPCGWTRR